MNSGVKRRRAQTDTTLLHNPKRKRFIFLPSVLFFSVLQMTLLEGNLAASGGFAYVSQQAWVLNESLKENILFGSEYDQDK